MVDVSGLKDRLQAQAAAAHELAVESVIAALQAAAPVDTGRLRDGVVEVVTDRAGPVLSSRVASTAVSQDGVDYGEIQDRGTGPIFPKGREEGGADYLHFTIGGTEFFIGAQGTSGVPATHWWSSVMTQETWHDALLEVLS